MYNYRLNIRPANLHQRTPTAMNSMRVSQRRDTKWYSSTCRKNHNAVNPNKIAAADFLSFHSSMSATARPNAESN